MKTPFKYSELPASPDYIISEDFISVDKYASNPVDCFRHSTPGRSYGILNPIQNSCFVIIERSTGTNVAIMEGDAGRELLKKCLDKAWLPRFYIPGTSFGLCNNKAEPCTPVEIKFHFFNKPTESEDLELVANEVINAFKAFYTFTDITVDLDLAERILKNEPAFFNIKLVDMGTHIEGVFSLNTSPDLYQTS